MLSNFEVVISGVSGRFPECEDVATFKEKLYALDTFLTSDERKWPKDFKFYRTGTK